MIKAVNLLAFPGVRRSAEDGFTSMRTFFSRNLQYTYLNFLSAEFSPKNNDFVAQVAKFHYKGTFFFQIHR